jgi:hypothetical protein
VVDILRRTLKATLAPWLVAAALLCSVAAALVSPLTADAGRYHVYSCRTPSGEVAPTDGWSGSVTAGDSHNDYAVDTCAEGGALIAALGGDATHLPGLDTATWTFAPPAGSAMAGATLWRAGDNAGAGNAVYTYEFWAAAPTSNALIEPCGYTLGCLGEGDVGVPFAAANQLLVPAADTGGGLYLTATCGSLAEMTAECQAGPGDANGYSSALYLYAADIVLEQSAGPTVSDVGSELAFDQTVHGTSDLSFTAQDPGAGIWKAVVEVDGQVNQTVDLDENDGHCRDVGQTTDGLPAFLYVQPCLPSVSPDLGLDTTRLTNGTHHLLVDVVDAAGNSTTVLNRIIDVENSPSPCAAGVKASGSAALGTLAVSWKGSKRTALTGAWGRTETILGRLTGPGGAPIAGAAVTLTATPRSPGGPTVAMAGPRTGADGRFTVRVPGTLTSRTLCLAYDPPGGDVSLASILQLNTRAGLGLHVHPHLTSIGHTIHFSGQLLGGPIPAGGKALVLEARSPGGRWIEFHVVHTRPHGSFTASYTFRFEGPAHYQFRAVSEAEADYPYGTGSSNVVGVYEG